MKTLFIFILALGLALGLYARSAIYAPGPLATTVNVVIPKGSGSRLVAKSLYENGVVANKWLFLVAARWYQFDKLLKAGEYQFPAKISIYEVMKKIRNGEVFYHKITFPEGVTSAKIGEIINEIAILKGGEIVGISEGYLLPETYSYEYGDERQELIEQAQKAMSKILNEAWINRDLSLPLKSPQELLVLASLVEKETGIAEERGLVASVLVNRLKKRMKLQTDPTVIYAITKGEAELGRSLTRADLQLDSPYNTYKYYGLPPAPICNPGRDSIWAAANPEASEYLYFVAKGNGGHNFSTNLNDHNKKVREWIKLIRKN